MRPSNRFYAAVACAALTLWAVAAWVFIPSAQRIAARAEARELALHEYEAHEPHERDHEESESPQARFDREYLMLRNPATKSIPENIHEKELAFARSITTRERIAQNAKNNPRIQAEAWTLRGPWNIGGRTRAFAVDVSDENVLLAGGISGGIWRSDDGGQSWRKVTAPTDLPNISCITQDTRPGKTNIWYAGTGESWGNSAGSAGAPFRGDGIYKSTDGGRTWARLGSTVTNTPQRYDQRFDYAWSIVTNPAARDSDEVYVAQFGCLQRSTDGGQTWRVVLGSANTSINGRFMDVAVTRAGVLYATISRANLAGAAEGNEIGRGIFRSTDGVRWALVEPPNFPTGSAGRYRRIVIGIANDSVAYFLAETPNTGFTSTNGNETESHSLWKYTHRNNNDSGSNSAGSTSQWEDRSNNLPSFTQGGTQGDYISQGSYDMCIRVHPTNENIVFIGGTNVYRSNDGFATNTQMAWIGGYTSNRNYTIRANHHVDQHVFAFLPSNPNVMLTANDGGIFRTDNCLAAQPTWQSLNNGYVVSQFYGMAIDPATSGNPVIIGGTQDNGSWLGNALSPQSAWRRVLSGDGGYCAVGGRSGSNVFVYAASQYGFIYRITTTSDFSRSLGSALVKPSGAEGFDFVTPFMLDPANPNVLYVAAGRNVWRNSDLASIPAGNTNETTANWTQASNIVGANSTVSAFGAAYFAARPQLGTRLYIGTSNGRVLRCDDAARGSLSATDVTGSSFPRDAYVVCIAVDPSNPDRAVVVFSNYEVQSLFLTENGGTSWTAIGGNLEQNPNGSGNGPSCRWASIMNAGGKVRVFVGTSTGLYSTERLQGASTQWIQEGASTIGNAVVAMLATRVSDGLVVAATHGSGVFSANVDTGAPLVMGDGVVLTQNAPNPFEAETTLGYKLTEQAVVNLAVYDMLGRLVATLASDTKSAGVHYAAWSGVASNGIPAASGMYFARLTVVAGGVTTVRTASMRLQR